MLLPHHLSKHFLNLFEEVRHLASLFVPCGTRVDLALGLLRQVLTLLRDGKHYLLHGTVFSHDLQSKTTVTIRTSVNSRKRCFYFFLHVKALAALHINSWQSCSFQCQLDFIGTHSATLQLQCKDYSFTYPPLTVARYSFMQLSELQQCVWCE